MTFQAAPHSQPADKRLSLSATNGSQQHPTWATAFLNPTGKDLTEARQLLEQILSVTITELSQAGSLAPVPSAWPEIADHELLPQEPVPLQKIMEASRKLIHGAMNPAHPRYMGHMDPLPTTASVAASLITAAVNNNLLSREMSPIFSDLEQRLLQQLAGLFGFPETAVGMLQSGGTLCNLQALTVARNAKLPVQKTGTFGLQQRPVIFASEACHSSIQKSAMILGLGTEGVISVPIDKRGKMIPDALEQAIKNSRDRQEFPFAVVATAGTTVTGNIDPLPELLAIARSHNLWLHVDASYGGAVIFHPQYRQLLQGIEQADSLTFNPQKWCYVTKACALVLFRNRKVLDDHFRIAAPYMSLNESSGQINLGEWGIQGTRAPDIAKWWLTLLQLGQSGLAELIDISFQQTGWILTELQAREYLKLATTPELNIVCFQDDRWQNHQQAQAEWHIRLQQFLLNNCQTFLSLPHYRQSRWLKGVLLNPFTTEVDFKEIFEGIDRFLP